MGELPLSNLPHHLKLNEGESKTTLSFVALA